MNSNKKIYIFGLVVVAVIIGTTAVGVGSLLGEQTAKKLEINRYLTSADDQSVIILKKGDVVSLELNDFGDGGYQWNIKTIDEELLSLTQRSDSEPSGMLGDFGNDIWVFTAQKTGSFTLALECQRTWDTTDICASFSVEITIE